VKDDADLRRIGSPDGGDLAAKAGIGVPDCKSQCNL